MTATAGVTATTHPIDERHVDGAQQIIPVLSAGQRLDVEALRHREEIYWRTAVDFGVVTVCGALVYAALIVDSGLVIIFGLIFGGFLALGWVGWRMLLARILGDAVRVGPSQFPHLYELVEDAANQLAVPIPRIFIFQGHGEISIAVAKRFTRRGVVLLTSNLVDKLTDHASSRQLMMVIGRELGHLAAGHFKLWYLRDVFGPLLFPIYNAWRRRCEITADRIGMLVAGDLRSAEQGLFVMTVGENLAASTQVDAIREQSNEVADSSWAQLASWLSEEPFVVDRVVDLHEFARQMAMPAGGDRAVAAVPLAHRRLKVTPIMLIHGHDRLALLEVKDFLRSALPHVTPLVMGSEMAGTETIPRKLELVAGQVAGAIALATRDDVAWSSGTGDTTSRNRARQNVVLEIGWVWGALGRDRCMLLVQSDVEVPSDLAGVEVFEYSSSPLERSEDIRRFVSFLDRDVAFRQ